MAARAKKARRRASGLGELPVCRAYYDVPLENLQGRERLLGFARSFLGSCFRAYSKKRQAQGIYGERFPFPDSRVVRTSDTFRINYYGRAYYPEEEVGFLIEGVGVTLKQALQHLTDSGFDSGEASAYLKTLPKAWAV